MYPVELKIKDTTESIICTSSSYLYLLLSTVKDDHLNTASLLEVRQLLDRDV